MLKKLAKRIEKELAQAADYCEQATLIKHHHTKTADLFAELAAEEIVHAEKLLREGQRLVDEKSTTYYDMSKMPKTEAETADHEKCKHIWEWEHRMAMDTISELKYKLSLFRNL